MEENKTFDMSGLKLAFWGMLFVAVNIRIMGFDLAPDVIGYILVIVGLGRIEAYDDNFSAAKKMAFVLAALSLANIVQAPAQSGSFNSAGAWPSSPDSVSFNAGIFGGIPWLATLMMVVGIAANLYFFYRMSMGMKNLLLLVGDESLAKTCDDRWKLILASEIGLLVALLSAFLAASAGILLTMIFGILAMVALVLFLILIYRAHKNIDGKERIV